MKVLAADLPDFIETVCWRIRQGVRQVRENNIIQALMPDTIDFSCEVMIRKDDLERIETSQRDPTTTTAVTGEQTSTSNRTGGGSVTDSTESSTTDDTSITAGLDGGGDTTTETSTEDGTDISIDGGEDTSSEEGTSTMQGGHSSLDTGGEIEFYTYVGE